MMHINPTNAREVKLFKNRRNQAIRIPVEFSFDVDTVRIRREGDALRIEPVYEHRLAALLDRLQPLEEDFWTWPTRCVYRRMCSDARHAGHQCPGCLFMYNPT